MFTLVQQSVCPQRPLIKHPRNGQTPSGYAHNGPSYLCDVGRSMCELQCGPLSPIVRSRVGSRLHRRSPVSDEHGDDRDDEARDKVVQAPSLGRPCLPHKSVPCHSRRDNHEAGRERSFLKLQGFPNKDAHRGKGSGRSMPYSSIEEYVCLKQDYPNVYPQICTNIL